MTRHDDVKAIAECRAESIDVTDLEGSEAGTRYDEHADKTRCYCRPAPPAGPFAKQGAGECGDHHRGEEGDRGCLRQLQRLQREKVKKGRAEQAQASYNLQGQALGAKHGRIVPTAKQYQDKPDMHHEPRPRYKGRLHPRQDEILGAGVKAREQ